MEELLKQLLQAELDKVQKAQAPAAPETPAAPAAPALDIAALAEALKPVIAAAVEENVAKAMPVRQEGVGPKGEPAQPQVNPIDELVKKASTDHKSLTPAEKNAIWSLTYAYMRKGLREDASER